MSIKRNRIKDKILKQEKTPRYSFRKFGIGLASALIGVTAGEAIQQNANGGVRTSIIHAETVTDSEGRSTDYTPYNGYEQDPTMNGQIADSGLYDPDNNPNGYDPNYTYYGANGELEQGGYHGSDNNNYSSGSDNNNYSSGSDDNNYDTPDSYETVYDSKQVSRNIYTHKEGQNGNTKVTTQTVTLSRTGSKDTTTGDTSWNDWSSGTIPEYSAPKADAGYTLTNADAGKKVKVNGHSSRLPDVVFNYSANPQSSSYKFVDDDANGVQVGKDQPLNGKTDQTISYTVTAPTNYVLANAQDAKKTYTFKASNNAPVVIHVKHATASAVGAKGSDDHRTITREIDITTPDGKQTVKRQTVEFTRPATKDMVTGQITYGPWSNNGKQDLPTVTLPTVDGYHPTTQVPAVTVTPDSKLDVVKISYEANDESVKLNFVDREGKVVGTKAVNGKYQGKYQVVSSDIPANYEADQELPVYTFTSKPDQSLTIKVKQNKDDYNAIGQLINVKHGDKPKAIDGIKNTSELPKGTNYTWDTEPKLPDGKTYGDTIGVVNVTYPDGSSQKVTVPVHFDSEAEDSNIDLKNKHQTYIKGQTVSEPTTKDLTGDTSNVNKVEWNKKPDTSQITSDQPDQVKVTFNDGSTTIAKGTYDVMANDSDKTGTIETQTIHVKHGQDPAKSDPKDGIKNKLPDGTKVIWTNAPKLPEGKTYGDTTGTAEIDYPDGSKTTAVIPVHVDSEAEDSNVDLKNKHQTYIKGQNVSDPTNKDLTGDTSDVGKVEWSKKPSTAEVTKNQPDQVKVTFNDGSTKSLDGTYDVVDNDSDKTGKIETQPIHVKHGQDPAKSDPKDGIKNKLPDGTKVIWTNAPKLPEGKTYGDTTGTAEIDYPDGSKTTAVIPVHVDSEAEDSNVDLKNKHQTYIKGQNVSDPTNKDLTGDTSDVGKVEWSKKPSTAEVTKNQPDQVKVTFNDGSTKSLDGTYDVVDNDSDKTGKIETQPIHVKHGQDPAKSDPKDGIKTKLPDGTKVIWSKAPQLPEGKTYGDTTGTAEITYPDGSKTTVVIPVHVDSEAEDSNASLKDKTYKENQKVANATIADLLNNDHVKSVVWKNKPNTSKLGRGTDSVIVTFDDGSTKIITGTYNVIANKAAKNNNSEVAHQKQNNGDSGNIVHASTVSNSNTDSLPQTGDKNSSLMLASGIASVLTAGVGLIAVNRKKKHE